MMVGVRVTSFVGEEMVGVDGSGVLVTVGVKMGVEVSCAVGLGVGIGVSSSP